LKNTVGTQWGHRDYVLLTEQWARDVGVDVARLGGERHSEVYEHIGNVECLVLNLAAADGRPAVLEPRAAGAQSSRCSYSGDQVLSASTAEAVSVQLGPRPKREH
jgi:hypothetical protein